MLWAHLKSDEDHAASRSTGLVLVREAARCVWDAAVAVRCARGASRFRLSYWMVRRFTGRAGTPLADERLLLFRIGTPGGAVRVFVRRNQSDLLILWEVFLCRSYELHEAFRLSSRIDRLDTIVDVGGNTGLAAAYLASRYRPRRLLTVEPIAESLAVLRRNAQLSPVRWILDDRAVTGDDGAAELEFAVSAFWDTCTAIPEVSRLRRSRPWRLDTALALPQRTLPAVSVPRLLDHHGVDHVDLLKVDIEGAEALLFTAPRPWMERVDRIVLEVHDKYIDGSAVRDTLHAAGFCSVPRRVSDPSEPNPVELYVRRGVPI